MRKRLVQRMVMKNGGRRTMRRRGCQPAGRVPRQGRRRALRDHIARRREASPCVILPAEEMITAAPLLFLSEGRYQVML